MLAMLGQRADGCIGKLLPAVALVRAGTMCLNRERGIEQQYALPSPATQVSAGRDGCSGVGLNLLEDIEQ